jgi:lysine/ornithine N-monooxygenase
VWPNPFCVKIDVYNFFVEKNFSKFGLHIYIPTYFHSFQKLHKVNNRPNRRKIVLSSHPVSVFG